MRTWKTASHLGKTCADAAARMGSRDMARHPFKSVRTLFFWSMGCSAAEVETWQDTVDTHETVEMGQSAYNLGRFLLV